MVIIHKKHKESAQEKESRLQEEQEKAMGLQDQYQARGFELVSWVQDHKGLVSLFIVAVLGLGAVYSGFLYYQKRASETASSAYLVALKDIDALEKKSKEDIDKLKVVQTSLTEIANSYNRSGVSVLANLYAGHLALQTSDAQASVALYQSAVGQIKTSDPLYPLALIGLGYAQEKSGDAKSALSSFESVVALKTTLGTDLALWEAARLAKNAQDTEKANKYLARLLEEYPASVYEKNAKKLKSEVRN
jgi:hypothetical protein